MKLQQIHIGLALALFMRIGLLMVPSGGSEKVRPAGITPTGDPTLAVLGTLPVTVPNSLRPSPGSPGAGAP